MTYTRELAALAGAYPAVKLGPPWWFNDSWNGMRRYFDQVMETTGIYNTCGFVDDTRALLSIPARHDVWRRASANWLAGLQVRGMIDRSDAETLMVELAHRAGEKGVPVVITIRLYPQTNADKKLKTKRTYAIEKINAIRL